MNENVMNFVKNMSTYLWLTELLIFQIARSLKFLIIDYSSKRIQSNKTYTIVFYKIITTSPSHCALIVV